MSRAARLAAVQHDAEASPRLTQDAYRTLVEQLPDAVLVHDGNRILLCNEAACRLLGARSGGELIGKSIFSVVAPMHHAKIRNCSEPLQAQRYVRLDGDTLDVEVTSAALEFEGKRLIQTVARDVTGRRRREIALLEAEARATRVGRMFAALNEANEALLTLRDEGELFQRVCDLAVRHGGLKLAAVRLVERSTGWIKPAASAGEAVDYLAKAPVSVNREQPEGRGPAAEALRLGLTTVSSDFLGDPKLALWRAAAEQAGIAATASIPLRRGGEVIGLLSLYSAEKNWFDPELVRLIERMAANVSFALDNLQREAQRRESEERYRTLVDVSPDAIFVHCDWRIVLVNQAMLRLFGAARPEQLLGSEVLDWVAPEYRERVRGRVAQLYEGGAQLGGAHLEYLRLDGTRFSAEVTAASFSYSGRPAAQVVARDITEKKHAEQALAEKTAVLRNTFEHMVQGISIMDADLRPVGWNRRFLEVLDLPESLFDQHTTLADVLRYNARRGEYGPGDVEEQVKQRLELARRFEPHLFERKRPDGTTLEVRGVPLPGGGFVTTYTDVTERKRTEQALRESEERFRSLAELSSDWYWEQDQELRQSYLSPDFERRSGVPADKVLGTLRWESKETLPLTCSWEEHRATLLARKPFRDFEFARTGADGELHYRAISGEPVFDEAGAFRGYRGVGKNITQRKRDEEALRVSTERFEIVARATNDVIWDLDIATEELWWSENLYPVFGYRPEEAGSRIEFWNGNAHPEDFERVVRGMQQAIDSGASTWQDEYRFRKADGSYAHVFDRGLVVQDERGKPVRVIGSIMDITARKEAEQHLARMAQFDSLTGLPNRNLLHDRLNQTIVRTRRNGGHAGVLFIDLDRFKLVNDTLGHDLGDKLIAQVGRRLSLCVRAGDTVGRISGDEFAVVLTELSRAEDAAIVAQKILDTLVEPFNLDGNEAFVTASIGISISPADGADAEALLKNADMAMYRAKKSGRNAYCFFTAKMNRRSLAKMQLNTDLRHAIERGEFELHYQPKVDLASGDPRGLEALLRWNHPQRGMVSPADFIPALEDSGLIVPVGEWVIEEACRQIRRWQLAGLQALPVAVNLSARQFRRKDLDSMIRRALAEAGVPAELLELEITESSLADDPEDAVRVLQNLRAAGVNISVDDFGTGYSSLSYLTRLPLTALKIDRSFVKDAHVSEKSAAIVRAVIDMAHNLRFTVIAEGVESDEHVAFLRRHGCDQAQGYLYARPMPARDVAQHLRQAAPR